MKTTPIDWLAIHKRALRSHEHEAAEAEKLNCPYVAQVFRQFAKRRRELIAALEKEQGEVEAEKE